MATEDNDMMDDESFLDNEGSENEIEGLGDDKKKNNIFFFGMLCLIVGVVIVILLGSSEGDVAKELDAKVDEAYLVSNNRDLNIPPPGSAPAQLFPDDNRKRIVRPEDRTPRVVAPPQPKRDNRAEIEARAERLERRSAQSVIFAGGGNGGGLFAQNNSDSSSINQGLIDSIQNAANGGSQSSSSPFAGGGGSDGNNSFSGALEVEPSQSVQATLLTDSNYTLAEGNLLGCILETAISTDIPGKTRCILSEDAYSYDGRVLLLEKGTRVIGEYQGGLEAGIKRIFIIWTRAITPGGIDIALNSGSTDQLGKSGAGVYVDNHFLERFGASTLLSLIGAASAGSGDDERLETAGENFNDSAAIALENSINIAPTGYKNQGDRIRIFVARDLDFSNVLLLKNEQLKKEQARREKLRGLHE